MSTLFEKFRTEHEVGQKVRIIVIGGGASGLCALRSLLDNPAHEVLLLERHSHIGGVWHSSDYPQLATHIKSFTYRFIDFHVPKSKTDYATRDEILSYFSEYVYEHGLERHIVANTEIIKIEYCLNKALQSQIRVHAVDRSRNESVLHCNYLVCGLGFINAGKPNVPVIPGADSFHGTMIHSSGFNDEMFTDIRGRAKRVCLIGGGKSAYDIALLFLNHGLKNQLTWIYRKFLWGINHDEVYSNNPDLIEKLALSGRLYYEARRNPDSLQLITLAKKLEEGKLFLNMEKNYNFHHFKGAHYKRKEMEALKKGIERIVGSVSRINEETIELEDGNRFSADYLICATGYQGGGNVPPIEVIEKNGTKSIIDPRDQRLLYRAMIDPRIPEIILFTGEATFPNQLYGYSLAAVWLKGYIEQRQRGHLTAKNMKNQIDDDDIELNQEVDERFIYRWTSKDRPETAPAYSKYEAAGLYRRQIMTDLGINTELQTQLNISQFDKDAFEKANKAIRHQLRL